MIKNKYSKVEQAMLQMAIIEELKKIDESTNLPPEEAKHAMLQAFKSVAKRAQDFDPVAQVAVVELFAGVIVPALEDASKQESTVSPSVPKPLDFDSFFK
jgi:hypothetical protein